MEAIPTLSTPESPKEDSFEERSVEEATPAEYHEKLRKLINETEG